jgi:hypothetical protein
MKKKGPRRTKNYANTVISLQAPYDTSINSLHKGRVTKQPNIRTCKTSHSLNQ